MTDGRETSGSAAGLILFAGLMMIMVGIWQALQGLIAIFENEFYVATRNYTFQFDATSWGWIHLLLGLLVAFAGCGPLRTDLGPGGRHHPGRAECDRQLPVASLPPVLGAAHHRGGCLCDLAHQPGDALTQFHPVHLFTRSAVLNCSAVWGNWGSSSGQ